MKDHNKNYNSITVTIESTDNGYIVNRGCSMKKVFYTFDSVVNELAVHFGLVESGEKIRLDSYEPSDVNNPKNSLECVEAIQKFNGVTK